MTQMSGAGYAQMGGQILSGVGGMFSAASASKAARAQALAEIDRLHREMASTRDKFAGAQDDNARKAEYEMGAMVAAMADTGAAGTLNGSRLMAESSFYGGLNSGRLDASQENAINSLKSQQVAVNQNALNVIGQAWNAAASNWMKQGASMASSAVADAKKNPQTEKVSGGYRSTLSYANDQTILDIG